MPGSLPCFSHISASRDVGQLRTTLSAFLHRSINTLMSSNLMTLIHEQWDEILRFIATIRLKVTTASQLFKRLNSHARQHPLYRALKEFGKIPKTLFILKYVDDPAFRQAIEKQQGRELTQVCQSHLVR